MKQLQFLNILLFCVFAFTCKTNKTFIKKSRKEIISLSKVSSPKILFTLQTADTLKFSIKDVCNEIEYFIKREMKSEGHVVSKDLSMIYQALIRKNADTIVFQNLSAVDSKTLSGNLDIWIARELLLKGKGEVCLHFDTQRISKLKYVYSIDKLNGEHGSFFTENDHLVFSTAISLGE